MVRLLIDFREGRDGLAFEMDAGVFSPKDAPEVAAIIRLQAEAAALEGEDIEFVGYRVEAVGGRA